MKITDMRVTDTIIDDSVETKGYNDSIVIDFKIGENEFKNILIQHDEYDDDYPAHQAAKEKGHYDSYEVYYEDDNSIKFRTFCEENNLDGTELLKEAGLDNLVLKELGVETEEKKELSSQKDKAIDFKIDTGAIDLSSKNKQALLQVRSYINKNSYNNIAKKAIGAIAKSSGHSAQKIKQVLNNISEKDLKSFDNKNTTTEQTKPTIISMADVLNGKASDTALKNQQDKQAEAGHRFFTKNSSDEKSKSH